MSVTYKEVTRVVDDRGVRFIWFVYDRDAKAGAHLWIQCPTAGPVHVREKCYGGIELHCATRPSWGGEQPDHECCGFIAGSCWSRGTSLGAERYVSDLCELGYLGDDDGWNAAIRILQSHLESEASRD